MRYWLPKLLAYITKAPRYIPEVEWSDKSWTHNIFRVYELIFGRRYVVRVESTGRLIKGKLYIKAHTFEAACALFETIVRGFFSKFHLPVKIWIPQLATPEGLPNFSFPQFVFAIALDNALAVPGTATQSFTCTGSNLVLGCMWFNLSSQVDDPTTIQYNGVTLTKLNSGASAAQLKLGLHYLAGPATGANNFVMSETETTYYDLISLSGANGTVANYATNVAVSGADITVTSGASDMIIAACYLVNAGTINGDGSLTVDSTSSSHTGVGHKQSSTSTVGFSGSGGGNYHTVGGSVPVFVAPLVTGGNLSLTGVG